MLHDGTMLLQKCYRMVPRLVLAFLDVSQTQVLAFLHVHRGESTGVQPGELTGVS